MTASSNAQSYTSIAKISSSGNSSTTIAITNITFTGTITSTIYNANYGLTTSYYTRGLIGITSSRYNASSSAPSFIPTTGYIDCFAYANGVKPTNVTNTITNPSKSVTSNLTIGTTYYITYGIAPSTYAGSTHTTTFSGSFVITFTISSDQNISITSV